MDGIKVVIINHQNAVKIPTGIRMLIRRCCNAVLSNEGFKGAAEVSVNFVDNAEIRSLNAKFRNKDIETDVLSFPLGENGVYDTNPGTGAKMLGDILICVSRAYLLYVCTLTYRTACLSISITHFICNCNISSRKREKKEVP